MRIDIDARTIKVRGGIELSFSYCLLIAPFIEWHF